jgi:serine protease Do
VPISMARQAMAQIIQHGSVRRGRIGVAIQDLTPEIAQDLGTSARQGAVVARVEAGSPAARAGLRAGDVIVAVDGAPITGGTPLHNRIGMAPIGAAVQLTVDRRGSERTITVRIEEASAARPGAR